MFDLRKLEGKAKTAIKKAAVLSAKSKEAAKVKKEQEKTKRLFGKIKFTVIGDMKVVNIMDWVSENLMDDSEQAIFNWCKKRKAFFYSKPTGVFNLEQAIAEAKKVNYKIVLVEET